MWSRQVKSDRRHAPADGARGASPGDDESGRHSDTALELGVWRWNIATDEFEWSARMFAIHDVDPGRLRPTAGYALERIHAADRSAFSDAVSRVLADRAVTSVGYRINTPTGDVKHLESVLIAADSHSPSVVGAVRDLTDHRRLERAVTALSAVTRVLQQWTDLDGGPAYLVATLGQALGCQQGALWVPSKQGVLEATHIWGISPDEAPGWRRRRLARGQELPGLAWQTGRVMAAAGPNTRHPIAPRAGARRSALGAALALPAVSSEEVLAVLWFGSVERQDWSARVQASLKLIAAQLGAFLARRRADLGPPILSARERQVLQLAADGYSGPSIAAELHLSFATVKSHFEHIYRKLAVAERPAAVAEALRAGLIQ